MEATLLRERTALWNEFNTSIAAVLKDPHNWKKREWLVNVCDTLRSDDITEFLLSGGKNASDIVVSQLPEKKGIGIIFEILKPAPSFEQEELFSNAANIVVKSGVFPSESAFSRVKNTVVVGGVFNGSRAFADSSNVIILGGTFNGSNAFSNSQNIIILGGKFIGGNNFLNAAGIKVFTGSFYGQKAFSHSVNVEVIDGLFAGDFAFEQAVATRVLNGKFTKQAAFSSARKASIEKGQFLGQQPFMDSKEVTVTGGEFHGEKPFEKSVGAKVWGGKWFFGNGQPVYAFQHAINPTVCINTPFESIDSPVNGVFVAQYFNNITKVKAAVDPKNTQFYVTDCRGKHDDAYHSQLRILKPEQLVKVNDPALFDRKWLEKYSQPCYSKGIRR